MKYTKIINKIEIREFKLNDDANEFIRCYNRAFITAPDPYRSLTLKDIQYFKHESTFVAVLHGKIVGFISYFCSRNKPGAIPQISIFSISWGKSYIASIFWIPPRAGMTNTDSPPSFPL